MYHTYNKYKIIENSHPIRIGTFEKINKKIISANDERSSAIRVTFLKNVKPEVR